jgi:hypothetical protein
MTDSTTGLPAALETLVQRAMARRDERLGQLTPDDLAALVEELALSDEVRKQIPGSGWSAQNRGRAALERKELDEAIEEGSAAAALLPGEAAPLELVAEAYRARWAASGLDWDRDQARRTAESALRINPTSAGAKAVLAHLSTGQRKKSGGGGTALPFVIAAVGLLFALGCALAVISVVVSRFAGQGPRTVVSEPLVIEDQPKAPRDRDRTLPVDVDGDEKLTFDIRRSELNNYDDVSWYKIAGVVKNERDVEFEKVEFLVELLDKNGKVITSKEASAPDTAYSGNAVRIGDVVEFNRLIKTDSRPRKVRLSAFVYKKEVPSSGDYPVSEKIVLKGKTPSKLEVRLRKVTDREKTILVKQKGERFHTIVLEVENVGGRPVRGLKLWAVYTDTDGKEVLRDDFYVVSSSDAPMLPKDVRLAFHIETVPPSVTDFHVRVATVE